MNYISISYSKLLAGLLILCLVLGNRPDLTASPTQIPVSAFNSSRQPMVTHVASGGKVGDVILISGQGLQSVTAVLFNGVPVRPVGTDPKGFFLHVQVPRQATTGPITLVTATGRLATNASFRVLPQHVNNPERQKLLDSDAQLDEMSSPVDATIATSPAPVRARVAASGGTISGIKFADLDRDGTRTVQTTVGSPVILFVLDVSGSTAASFPGTTVGDLNGRDGANDIIDAEIGVVERIRTELISRGAVNSQIGIVTFQTTAATVDVDPTLASVQNFAKVGDDKNNNGKSDISETYTTSSFISGGNTSYTNGLKQALTLVNTLPPTQEIKIIFLSDGTPNPTAQNGVAEATTLKSKPNVTLSALGIGATTLSYLKSLDPNARAVTDFTNLINFSLEVITPLENGLAGVVLYLDQNNNSQRDPGEPSQTALSDNPATPADETGLFSFTGLAPGTYTVREEVPVGYVQTAPANKAYTFTISGTQSFTSTNFGNFKDSESPVIAGVPASLTVNCPGDVPAMATGVSATDNLDLMPTLSVAEARVDGTCPNQYVITRTWTATDEAQNQTTATQTIIVADLTAPVLSGVPSQPIVVSAPADACSVIVPFPAISAADNCSGAVTLGYKIGNSSVAEGAVFSVGSTTVVVTATDPCGNQVSDRFIVQINDVTPPVPTLGSLPALIRNCSVEISNRPVATDNCGSQITATTSDPLTYSLPGSYTITWMYTDPSGNSSQQTQLIQVTEPPLPITAVNVNYCLGATASPLSATATNTGVLKWYDASNQVLAGAPTPATSTTGSTGYFLSQLIDGCESKQVPVTVTVNPLPTLTINGLASTYCQDATAASLAGSPAGGTFTIDGQVVTVLTPSSISVGQHAVVYSYTSSNGCTSVATQPVTTEATPQPPVLLTQNGQIYSGGQSSVTVPQYSGTVTLIPDGCSGGSIRWNGPAGTTGTGSIVVSTTSTGSFVYHAICQKGNCASAPTSATVTVKADPLRVIAPLFDCATGKLTLRTTGGNGQPIEYQVPSVNTGWSPTNPLVVSAKDFKKVLKLRARQSSSDNHGYDTAELDYQLPACSTSARLAVSDEIQNRLHVAVLGNPIEGQEVIVEVRGAQGQPLHLMLTDLSGRLVSSQAVEVAEAVEQRHLPLNQTPAGMLLLQVSTPTQRQELKVLKP